MHNISICFEQNFWKMALLVVWWKAEGCWPFFNIFDGVSWRWHQTLGGKKKPKQAVKLTTHNFYVNMSCSGREIFIRDFHYSLGILFNIFERGQFRETAGNERRARSTFLNWIICSSGRCQSAVVANELITAFLEQNQTFVAFCAFFLFPLFPVCLFFNLNWSDKRKKKRSTRFCSIQSNFHDKFKMAVWFTVKILEASDSIWTCSIDLQNQINFGRS